MICSLSKWFISGSVDSNKEVPRFIQNHIIKCDSCREFLLFSQVLEDKAAKDAASIFQEIPDSFMEKVKATRFQQAQSQAKPRLKRTLIPTVSVAMAAIVIVLFIVFSPNQSSPPPLKTQSSILTGGDSFLFGRDSTPGGSLQNLASQLESPFGAEWMSLKNAVKSATDGLTNRLDLRIEKREN